METIQTATAEIKPLDGFGSLLKNTYALTRSNASRLFLISGIQMLVAISIVLIAGQQNSPTGQSLASLAGSLIGLFTNVIMLLVINANVNKEDSSLSGLTAKALKLLPAILLITVLVGLFVFGSAALLVFPLIIFSIWNIFTTYVVVLEGGRGFDAIAKSSTYVSNYWLPLFGRSIFSGVLIILPTFLLRWMINGSLVKPDLFIDNITVAILTPFLSCYLFSLYKNIISIKTTAVPILQKRKMLIKIVTLIGAIAVIAIIVLVAIGQKN